MLNINRFIGIVKARFNNNKNWLAVITGDTGSGKSYVAMQLADMISPNPITIKRNVILGSKIEFMKKLVNFKSKKQFEAGDILVFDEAGVSIGARDWYTISNKMLMAVIQTFRAMNIGVIFTVPDLGFIDIQARKLLHHFFQTKSINYKNETVKLKVQKLVIDRRTGKIYWPYPVVQEGYKSIRIKHLNIRKPREELFEEYEIAKEKFLTGFNKRVLKEVEYEEAKKQKKMEPTKKELITKALLKNPNANLKEIAKQLDVGLRYVQRIKSVMVG